MDYHQTKQEELYWGFFWSVANFTCPLHLRQAGALVHDAVVVIENLLKVCVLWIRLRR